MRSTPVPLACESRPSKAGPGLVTCAVLILTGVITLGLLAGPSLTQAADTVGPTFPPDRPPPPTSLKGVAVPLPPNLSDFVVDQQAAIALGKALFWDEQAGSDGQACASCHFQAGADNRVKNQLSPGLRNVQGGAVSTTFNLTASNQRLASAPPGGGPNYTLKRADFPFHQLLDPANRNSQVLFDTDDVVSSQGVFHRDFVSLMPSKQKADACATQPSFFNVGGILVRQVEPRNTPTVVNAIFNFRNFWDGRANNVFNGRNPFGLRDPTAGVDPNNSILVESNGALVPFPVIIPDASLASQADGPVLSDFEMSCGGRVFEEVGKKLLKLQPLAKQKVDPTDGVLGGYVSSKSGTPSKGLVIGYDALIKRAFQPKFWNSSLLFNQNGVSYAQMQKNFSLFWGLSIMLYESTLVSDDAPFDHYATGDINAMTNQQVQGFIAFNERAGCVFCHKGPEFTSAASLLRRAKETGNQVENMVMGDGNRALYDSGFYNIGVRRPGEDIGTGGTDPWGNPLSWSRQAKNAANVDRSLALFNVPVDEFNVFTCNFDIACLGVSRDDRDAVDGSFKTPTLRNIELTGPYFHNGGQATLEQVVAFYDRGGDASGTDAVNATGYGTNPSNRAPAIQRLFLSDADEAALVAFMKALTDERVRWEKAPFDHPELHMPNGQTGDQNKVQRDSNTGYATDDRFTLPAVGAAGRAAQKLPPLAPFEAGLK